MCPERSQRLVTQRRAVGRESGAGEKSGRDYRPGFERAGRVHRIFRDLHGLQAICAEIEEVLYRDMKRAPEQREGHRSAGRALLDFGGFIVHVFCEQSRRFYDLERLWRQAPSLLVSDEPGDGRRSELSEKAG